MGENKSTGVDTWEWSDDHDSKMIRGVFISGDLGDRLNTDLVRGVVATLSCRVHNFSLVAAPRTQVLFQIASLDAETGTTGTKAALGTATVASIPAWGETSPNWKLANVPLDTMSFEPGNYRIFVTVDPNDSIEELPDHDNGDERGNNEGWYDIFLYDQEDSDSETAKSGIFVRTGAEKSTGLALLQDRIVAEKTVVSPNERTRIAFYCKNVGERALTNLHILFFKGHPDESVGFDMEHLAGLLPGAKGRVVAKFSSPTPGTYRIYGKVLPKYGEEDLEDNLAWVDITVKESSGDAGAGGGGCDAGSGAAVGLLLLPPLALLGATATRKAGAQRS